jgi:cytochrome P450
MIRSDHSFLINIHALQHNPSEWKEPYSFIPERFDPSSEYFKTPGGMKRHPMSYGPFLGGKRICIGKTFAENIGKAILLMLLLKFDYEFIDKELYDKKPPFGLGFEDPKVMTYIKKRI